MARGEESRWRLGLQLPGALLRAFYISVCQRQAKLESDLKNADMKLLVLHEELLTLNELEDHPFLFPDSGGVRVRFRVRFQAVKVPILGGFLVECPTNKATASRLF